MAVECHGCVTLNMKWNVGPSGVFIKIYRHQKLRSVSKKQHITVNASLIMIFKELTENQSRKLWLANSGTHLHGCPHSKIYRTSSPPSL